MIGPGKYDELCTLVREKAGARAAIVIVVDGDKGTGFSAQGTEVVVTKLPAVLRILADKIEADAAEVGSELQ